MRVELPVRIPIEKTLIFSTLLLAVQLLEHTNLVFALLFFVFIVVANIAFNIAGGFSRASGAYVFLFALLTCGIGVTWKAVLGEPADSHLLVPTLDMECYAASMVMLLLVVLANKLITGKAKGIAPHQVDYTLAAVGCLVVGLLLTVLTVLGLAGPGSLLGVVNQLNQFLPLAIILGTIGAIKDSGGRRSVNAVSCVAITLVGLGGTLAFSKTGMYQPMAAWLVGAAFTRLRLRLVHFIVLPAFAVFAFAVAPTLAGGRIMVSENAGYTERIGIVYYLLTHLGEAKLRQMESISAAVENRGHVGYYDNPQGLIDRLTILSADDSFFNYTNRGNYVGYRVVAENYENFVPHFLAPNKPVPIGGNYYAHEIGGYLADDDDSTGISFSPVAETFHVDGWTSLLLVLPAVWLSLFVGADFLCGDLRRVPWGLPLVVIFEHAAAESGLGALIWLTGFGLLGILMAIVFCTNFAPVLGALLYGTRRSVRQGPSGNASVRPAHSS
jgi:hypothetical protein